MKRILCLVAVGVLSLALSAGADEVLYDQSWIPGTEHIAPFSDADFFAYDNFWVSEVAEGFVVSDLHWWGAYYFGNPVPGVDNFGVAIYQDVVGSGSLVAQRSLGSVSRVDTGLDAFGSSVFYYEADFEGIDLDSGHEYWLSIVNWNYGYSRPGGINWAWMDTATEFGDDYSFQIDNYYSPGYVYNWDGDLAFVLTGGENGIVPEPATMSLLGLGLAGLGLRRRIFRR